MLALREQRLQFLGRGRGGLIPKATLKRGESGGSTREGFVAVFYRNKVIDPGGQFLVIETVKTGFQLLTESIALGMKSR